MIMGKTKFEKLFDKAMETGLPVHDGMSLEDVEAAISAAGGAPDDEQERLGEEEAQGEGTQEMGDQEGAEDEEEEALELDWKSARTALKEADKSVGWSIDEFDKRANINALKKRYNDKERTQSLFDAIMALR